MPSSISFSHASSAALSYDTLPGPCTATTFPVVPALPSLEATARISTRRGEKARLVIGFADVVVGFRLSGVGCGSNGSEFASSNAFGPVTRYEQTSDSCVGERNIEKAHSCPDLDVLVVAARCHTLPITAPRHGPHRFRMRSYHHRYRRTQRRSI